MSLCPFGGGFDGEVWPWIGHSGGEGTWTWVESNFVEIDSYAIASLCSLVEQVWLLDGAYSWCEGVHHKNNLLLARSWVPKLFLSVWFSQG